jgi:signal transduction histidine kinase
MDEEHEQVHTFLSTPEGKAIASFQLPFNDMDPLPQLLPHWQRKEIYIDHWDEAAFIDSTKILLQRGAIASPERYTTEHRPTNLHLHFLPFLQGMLYVGSEVPLSKDELELVKSLADAFSTAYARYEDFNKLESANIKIEKTLVDLKQTQAQLVQSEKMASLGELTAGIAHEIQNPLNFVNNFSEVSNELLDEMSEELDKGELEEAKAIANDVKQNLEKILHHGKRADGIVKGMLQHSRSSSGVKEPTDINVLCDEYLRLSYHGLRAKDKSFNAKFETHLDPTLLKVNVVPQDIGRVVLNLINNAFYAVNERVKSEKTDVKSVPAHVSPLTSHYEPTVTVSTKKLSDKIEIRVKDNGNGIPDSIKEKIFQPFFTTKPTGQGTGLGLSLSYDIVKAHGGELKVETKEGAESEFIIQLPIV